MLKSFGLLHYFTTFVFSDEVGAAKPAAHVFQCAREQFKVEYPQMLHIGDREANDIVGPHHVGMKSILYTGVIDRGTIDTKASARCEHYADLPAIIKTL